MASTDLLVGTRARGITLVATAGLLWSTVGLGVRFLDANGPWRILFFRAIVQVIVICALVAVRNRGSFVLSFTRIGWSGLLSALMLSAASISTVYAIIVTTVAEFTLIFSSAPVLAGLLGWLILRETISRRNWLTMGLAAIGLIVITSGGGDERSALGAALSFLSALGFAAFSVLQRRGKQVDMVPVVAVAGLMTLIFTGPLIEGPISDPWDLMVVLYLGGVVLAGGLTLYTIGSRHVRIAELVLIAMLEVVFAPVWVWWLFGETVATSTALGGVMVLAAVAIQAGGRETAYTQPGPAPEAKPSLRRRRLRHRT